MRNKEKKMKEKMRLKNESKISRKLRKDCRQSKRKENFGNRLKTNHQEFGLCKYHLACP